MEEEIEGGGVNAVECALLQLRRHQAMHLFVSGNKSLYILTPLSRN